LKAVRKKCQITIKVPIRITADFSTETLIARRAWNKLVQALKENNFKPGIIYPAQLSFKMEAEIKAFHFEHKLKQYVTTKSPLKVILKGILHKENGDKCSHGMGIIKSQEMSR
jgi:hypothetical protein